MHKHAQPMSPRTQAFGQAPSGDEETRLFEEGFSQMAYNVLVSKFPDLMQSVITFKVLDSDVESGSGVGAFVVQHENEILYVPVVMADNQIKPLDMFYHKDLNIFLPLNNDWLEEVSQLTLDEMGEPVQTPKSLRRDVDTRHIMIPPTTGRYAYAAARRGPLTPNSDLYEMLRKLQTKMASAPPALVEFLKRAPNTVKEAFANTLRSRPKLAAQVTLLYGIENLEHALTRTKEAGARDPYGGGLWVLDRDTPGETFKAVFGDRAPEAFQGVLDKGYTAKDNRQGLNGTVQLQPRRELTEPSQSGFYRVYTQDGGVEPAFVLVDPRRVLHSYEDHSTPEGRHGKRHAAIKYPRSGFMKSSPSGYNGGRYLVIMRNGRWLRCDRLVGQQLDMPGVEENRFDLFGKLMNGTNGDNPRVGDRGVFIKKLGQTFVGTEPFKVKSITTDSDGVRRITSDDYDNTVFITDAKAGKAGLHQPKGYPLVYIPADARFIRLQDRNEMDIGPFEVYDDSPEEKGRTTANKDKQERVGIRLLSNPTDVLKWFYDKFDAMGANSFSIKNAGAGQFSVDGEAPLPLIEAMKHAALKHNISFHATEQLVKQAEAMPNGRVEAFVLTPAMEIKLAQAPMMGGPGMDPSMGGAPPPGMDPAAMGGMPPGPPPGPPSPLDIAMGEAQTQIQQQMADLQQQNMALQDKAQTLMMVGQRAQEIAGGGAAAVGQGAPPMPMPGMGGGAPPAGAMPGGAMPPGGGMPGPAPQMAGGGMAAAGMSPEGMPPEAMMGGQAAMTTESPSAMEIQNQINPQFLEQAGALNDTGAFDAAAIASMAQAPSFRDIVVDYVPTLERALDNLGRILLTMWMQESQLKEQLGDEDFGELEDNVRAVFDGLGSLILQVNRNAIVMEPGE